MLRVVVSDDGCGITAKGTRGFGLAGMNERVASLDGRLRIADREGGKGVMLIVEIPVPRGSPEKDNRETLTSAA
jgi:two-component system sensor histidine kinase UhpB